jgi:hypothetical protein
VPTERDQPPPHTFRVPLEHLLLKHPVTAGMDLDVVAALVPLLRETTQDHDPIEVSWMSWVWSDTPSRIGRDRFELWRIQDGRHRFFASVVAGRSDILCRDVGVK